MKIWEQMHTFMYLEMPNWEGSRYEDKQFSFTGLLVAEWTKFPRYPSGKIDE